MRCSVESVQLVGTTYFTKETLDEVKIRNGEVEGTKPHKKFTEYLEDILTPSMENTKPPQTFNEYVENILKPTVEDDEEDAMDDEFVCGICQISFSRHCCHCTVPSEIKAEPKVVNRIEIEPKKFVNTIANVHNGCSLAKGMCGHYFHYHCIEKWLGVPDAADKCPMCRQDFVEHT